MAGPREVALALSLARRRGDDLVVRVQLPTGQPPAAGSELLLRRHGVELTAAAEVVAAPRGCVVAGTFTGPVGEPGSSTSWRLHLRSGSRTQRIGAFVRLPADGPVALLWGDPAGPTGTAAPSTARAAGARAGALADRELAVLPTDRALRLRGALRSAGRRVLR
ncbi:hypothetical protein [Angustibacter aerolatus]